MPRIADRQSTVCAQAVHFLVCCLCTSSLACDASDLHQAAHSHPRLLQQPQRKGGCAYRRRCVAVYYSVCKLTQSVESQVAFTVVLLGWPSSSSIRKKLAPGPASMGTAGNRTTGIFKDAHARAHARLACGMHAVTCHALHPLLPTLLLYTEAATPAQQPRPKVW